MAAATTTTSSSISSLSTSIMQELLVINFHSSRKLLLHNPLYTTPPLPTPPPSQQPPRQNNTFDANVVMVLSVLLCALICSLGLNSIIRCALRCSSLVGSADSANSPQAAQQCQLANTGIKKKALKTFPTISFSADLKLPGLDTECAICLSEFTAGERVRVLPKCHHGFHVRCIDKWLNCHSSCPTCRHCLIETCNKIVASTTTPRTTTQSLVVVEEVCVRIEPLHPEGLIRNYQT
ncbi:hypothetical protein ABFS82_08G097400 [Erythranthe guttata]|uniref:RING-type E3 ubiquitin transferase n=1 Tax=Erythranthe guttata TaxID=4155 RepID=A0A022RUU2_ERYGU|nr:PREDICTED: RING-H2 finger protein ATL78-like [Erythranthe guttata]EYU43498.1 hypothetical protein MIMGU_mgv1a017986mg [Erythranthe guttata]|eukprot:XP_012829988.1 PREDICTED: RING-H2 finger protein ATL78-like [Erythranthe guttata]